jgi:hypothetical protein
MRRFYVADIGRVLRREHSRPYDGRTTPDRHTLRVLAELNY